MIDEIEPLCDICGKGEDNPEHEDVQGPGFHLFEPPYEDDLGG